MRLEAGLLLAAALLSGWGLFASEAEPHRATVLARGADQHDPHGDWGLQTIEAALELRPWHPGYAETRTALARLTEERRRAVTRW